VIKFAGVEKVYPAAGAAAALSGNNLNLHAAGHNSCRGPLLIAPANGAKPHVSIGLAPSLGSLTLLVQVTGILSAPFKLSAFYATVIAYLTQRLMALTAWPSCIVELLTSGNGGFSTNSRYFWHNRNLPKTGTVSKGEVH
jgi:hypothetical protein